MSNFIPSGLKIFDVIDILLQNPKSREEIAFELSKRGVEVEAKTISKYIRTLNMAGFEVSYGDCGFEILNTPFKTKINEKSINGAKVLFCSLEHLFQNVEDGENLKNKLQNYITNFEIDKKFKINEFPKISKAALKNIIKIEKIISKKTCEARIKYDGQVKNIILNKILYKKNGIFIVVETGRIKTIQTINIEKIESVKARNVREREYKAPYKKTVFKISDKLAKNYVSRTGETVKYTDDGVYVTNMNEPKNELFFRLLKYGFECEIVEPESDRRKFINFVKDMLEYYKSL